MTVASPHLRDWFAGYKFAPRHVAVENRGVWVADNWLPIFVHVDLETGAVSEPWSAQDDLGLQLETQACASDEAHIYVVGHPVGLAALDKASGKLAWQLQSGWWQVVASRGRVWSTVGGDIVELDVGGQMVRRVGLQNARCLEVAPQDGWQAVFATPHRQIKPVIIARFESGKFGPTWSVQLEGSAAGGWRRVYASDEVVWTFRQTIEQGAARRYLCGLDAETGDLVSEIELDLDGRTLIHDGFAWSWKHLSPPGEQTFQRKVDIFDPATNELLARHDLGARNYPHPASGPAGVWCAVWNDGPWLKGLTAPTESAVETISLASVDASAYRPPPPPPITADDAEAEALARIRSDLRIGMPVDGALHSSPWLGVDVEDVVLEEGFPETRLVVYFRAEDRPGYLFARAVRLWEGDGTFNSDYYLAVTTNLEEDLMACGSGLPVAPQADDTGVVWI